MIEFSVNMLVFAVCISEILYIIFRNPLINHFSLPILVLSFITQLAFLGYSGEKILFRIIASSVIIIAAFLKWKYPHRSFEKPDWRYLTALFMSAIILIII